MLYQLFAATCAAVILASCSGNSLTQPEQIIFPDSAISYQTHVKPLLQLTCVFAGCHDSESKAGGTDLSTYFSMNERAGLIVPGKPDQSLLVQIVEGRQGHLLSFQQRINTAQKNGIRRWVLEGAKNN
jgi:hypothetical protein